MRNGSERVVSAAREHTYDMRQLESYTFTDEHNRDQGINGELVKVCAANGKGCCIFLV